MSEPTIVLNILIALLIFFGMLYFALVSKIEREKLAFRRAIALAVLLPTPYVFYVLNAKSNNEWIGWSLIYIVLIVFLVLILPIRSKFSTCEEKPKTRIDERDTMFSRREIEHYPERLTEYYQRNPDKNL